METKEKKYAATMTVEYEDGSVLLLKRKEGTWAFPGGKLESGEDLIDCAIRELGEETDYYVLDRRKVQLLSIRESTGNSTGIPYIMYMFHTKASNLTGEITLSAEHDDWGYANREMQILASDRTLLSDAVFATQTQAFLKQELVCYRMISAFYEGKKADRSGVPYMQHINEGLDILGTLCLYNRELTPETFAAFMLHPFFQSDGDFLKRYEELEKDPHHFNMIPWRVMFLILEYRKVANSYLCNEITDNFSMAVHFQNTTSKIEEVYDMLYADKLQNQKDFRKHHYSTHRRANQLENYFQNWMALIAAHRGTLVSQKLIFSKP